VLLRSPEAQKIQSLEEFITEYIEYTEKCNTVMEEYIKSIMGEKVAIVLDGYDELPEEIRKNPESSFFIKSISKNVMTY